jgi:hypothetical protein
LQEVISLWKFDQLHQLAPGGKASVNYVKTSTLQVYCKVEHLDAVAFGLCA